MGILPRPSNVALSSRLFIISYFSPHGTALTEFNVPHLSVSGHDSQMNAIDSTFHLNVLKRWAFRARV
jgi:hypothetical protein